MLSPRWIFLDFDGVVMDSMTIKLDAYCYALAEYGFPRERIREQQLLHAGLSRSRALPLMYDALSGGAELSTEDRARALRHFAEEDLRLRPQMRLMPGAREFLEEANARGVPLALVTGTPQEVIDGTVELFDLRRHFREVHGHPPIKADCLRDLLARHGLRPREAIYAGDAVQDALAAETAGIPFVGIDNGENPFKKFNPVAIVKSLKDVKQVVGWG